jgi:pimeloyl-ACP methyl ester carboxylesterase
MLMPGWWYVITAESFLDRRTAMPDILDLAPSITCPVLYIRGDEESVENYPAEAFRDCATGPCEVAIIPNCDHFYRGREGAVVERVTAWLRKTLTAAG